MFQLWSCPHPYAVPWLAKRPGCEEDSSGGTTIDLYSQTVADRVQKDDKQLELILGLVLGIGIPLLLLLLLAALACFCCCKKRITGEWVLASLDRWLWVYIQYFFNTSCGKKTRATLGSRQIIAFNTKMANQIAQLDTRQMPLRKKHKNIWTSSSLGYQQTPDMIGRLQAELELKKSPKMWWKSRRGGPKDAIRHVETLKPELWGPKP